MSVHATESPNTATVWVPGARRAGGEPTATGTSAPTSTPVSAVDMTSGPGGCAGWPPTGMTTVVTTAAVATVAAASRSIGTWVGRHRRTGCSIAHHDSADTAIVTPNRNAMSDHPVSPVRSPLRIRKIGQCHR